MAQFVEIPSEQNYYFKDSVAYTEDHIPVQKLYMYSVPPELSQSTLEEHFGMYGRVLRLQVFRPRNVPRGGRVFSHTGYVFFAKKTDAAKALHSRIHHLNGRKFNVQASDSWHQPDAYGMPRHLPVMLPTATPLPPPPALTLNDHCLEFIMEYLSLPDQIHFARSCLRFRAIYQAASARLHKFVNLCQFEDMTVWDMRDFFKLSGPHVQKVTGVMPGAHAQRLCDFLAASCTNLKSMNVLSNLWSGRNMHKIFAKMYKLESLQLPMSNLSDGSLLALRNLRSLKTLNLSNNPLVGDTISKLPATIETLTLNGCQYFEMRHLTKILATFSQLKELNIKNIDPNGVPVYESIVKKQCCTPLETLRLTGYGHVPYEFVAQLPSLKHLSIFTKLTDRYGLRKELFEQLVEHKAAQLERLELFGPSTVTKEMLANIAKLGELRDLVLSSIASESALEEAFTNHQKLQKFILRHSSNVSEKGIVGLLCACPKLSYIGLEDYMSVELLVGIVSRVQKEIARKEMQRKLPIELWTYMPTNLAKIMETHSEKLPTDIIQIKCSSHRHNMRNFDFYNMLPEDFENDQDDLDLEDLDDLEDDTDDDDAIDYFYDREDMYDMGFLSDDDDDDDEDDMDSDYAAEAYVHPSWPYDRNGEFIGFGLLDDD